MQTLRTVPQAADFPGYSREAFHLLERMPDAIILLDGGGHIEFVNARAEQMFGYRREELAGKPVDVLIPGHRREIHIGHRLRDSAGRRKDGTAFPVEISRSPPDRRRDSPPSHAIRETSECEEARGGSARLAADLGGQARLLDLACDAILVRDMDRAITFWNRGAEVLYGWLKDEALGRTVHELLETVFPGPIEDIEAEILRTGRWEGELGHSKRDGSRVVMSSHWSLQRDEHGRPVAILMINSDITDYKERRRGAAGPRAPAGRRGRAGPGRHSPVSSWVASWRRPPRSSPGTSGRSTATSWSSSRMARHCCCGRARGGGRDSWATPTLKCGGRFARGSRPPCPRASDHRRPPLRRAVRRGLAAARPGHGQWHECGHPQPGAPYGCLSAFTARERKFTRDDSYFLQAVANVLGLAIERKRHEQDQRERDLLRAEQMAAVGQVAAGRRPRAAQPAHLDQGAGPGQPAGGRGRAACRPRTWRVIEHEIRRMERTLQTFLDFARPPQPDRRRLDLAAVVDRVLALVGGRGEKQQVDLRSAPARQPASRWKADRTSSSSCCSTWSSTPWTPCRDGGTVEIELRPPRDGLGSRSTSATPARGSPRTSCRRVFETFVSSKETGGWGWGCRCRGGSPRTTAAASPPTTCPRAGPASCSGCPPSATDARPAFGRRGGAMPTLLVVDDEPSILHFFRRAFPGPEVTPR